MEEIISYIAKNGGVANIKEMENAKIHTPDISDFFREKMIY